MISAFRHSSIVFPLAIEQLLPHRGWSTHKKFACFVLVYMYHIWCLLRVSESVRRDGGREEQEVRAGGMYKKGPLRV